MELEDLLYEKIKTLCAQGDAYVDKGELSAGIERYKQAEALLPEPKTDWEAATWIYASIADAYFLDKNFSNALEYMITAYNSPGGPANPFINLRIGESYYESGEIKKAKEFLLRAYMWEGDDIYVNEDPKYFKLIDDII